MNAKLIKTGLLRGDANLYQLEDDSYVMVSRADTPDRGDETMIFPANADGEVTDWEDLYAGYGESHNEALSNYGYTVE
jgi:hypothetical protein